MATSQRDGLLRALLRSAEGSAARVRSPGLSGIRISSPGVDWQALTIASLTFRSVLPTSRRGVDSKFCRGVGASAKPPAPTRCYTTIHGILYHSDQLGGGVADDKKS
jgi:hypothetical protein